LRFLADPAKVDASRVCVRRHSDDRPEAFGFVVGRKGLRFRLV
jgi:hypothetical protein